VKGSVISSMSVDKRRQSVSSVTLVVPCFNEQDVILEFYRRVIVTAEQLLRRGIALDILFVDDCSRDQTWPILEGLAENDQRVRAMRLARNCGHQIAVTAGVDIAEGDVVVILDADLQDPPELVGQMINLIEEGHDIVHAQRRTREGETAFKLATARMFYLLLKRFATFAIVENAGDFRAITRPVVLAAREFREPHRFLRGMFSTVGFRQTIMQYDRDARFAGVTKYPLKRMLRLAADAIFSFSSAPIKAIVWCSFALWGCSLCFLAWSIYAHFFLKSTTVGWTSLAFLLIFFTGLILMSTAVVGSYVGRIFEQGQHRPLYWLEQACNIRFDGDSPSLSSEARLSRRIIEAHNAMSVQETGNPVLNPCGESPAALEIDK